MSTGFEIRPRVITKGIVFNANTAWIVRDEVAKYLQQLEPVVRTSVQQKMRRGISPYQFSERNSVEARVVVGNARLALSVSSNSVRAAVDETGANYSGVPPFGPQSALLEWVIQTLNPRNPRWTAKRVAIAIHDRGLPRPGDPLRQPFATTHRELGPQIRKGLVDVRARAANMVNRRGATS